MMGASHAPQLELPCSQPLLPRAPTHPPSPKQLRTHPVLLGECLGGALYINDFIRLARQVGGCGRLLRKHEEEDFSAAQVAPIAMVRPLPLGHLTLAPQVGFMDPRLLESSEVAVNDPELKEVVGEARFYSITYR